MSASRRSRISRSRCSRATRRASFSMLLGGVLARVFRHGFGAVFFRKLVAENGQNAVRGAAVASPRSGPVCSAPPGRRCRRRCVLCCHDAANAALRHRSNACSSGVGAAERASWGDWAGAWAPLPGSRHAMHTLQFSGLAAASRWRSGGGCRRTRGAAAGTGDRRVDARHGAAADYA